MKRSQLLNRLRAILVKRRDALRQALSADPDIERSNEAPGVGDVADAAQDAGYRELHAGLVEAETRELANIERAMERFQEGSYGVCERCGKHIPVTRLQALPYATLCIECQKRQESGQGQESDQGEHDSDEGDRSPGRDSGRRSGFRKTGQILSLDMNSIT